MRRIFAAALIILGLSGGAQTAPIISPCLQTSLSGECDPVNSGNPMPVTGSLSIGGSAGDNADGVAAVSTGLGQQQVYPYLWNGTTFDRWYGDKTNGAFVNVKSSVALAVTGTFWPYTLGQQLAAASVPVVLTAAQLATLTPPAAITGYALDTSVGTTNTDLGPPGATACATDTGSCSLNALIQRLAQRLTTLNTTLGSPFQAGGSVTQSAGPANVTATDCSGTVTSGGTAQNAFTAQTTLHGFTIANIDTTEPLWISFTTTAAASGSGSYPLPAATPTTFAGFGSFTTPPGFGLNHALSVIAATTSHKFTCTWW